MRFSDITGNEEVKRTLAAMCDSGRMPHAMMLYENEGCGALPTALAFVQYLNCRNRHDGDSCGECPSCRKMAHLVHPDVHFVYPVNSGSKIDASKKPTSESYLEYWRKLVTDNPYFLESDLYSALGIDGKAGVIAVAEAKSIIEALSFAPVEDGYRAVIVWLPEKMNAETANRLLKSIEEPPDKTVFVFITHNPDKVLPTILSRCQNIRIAPLSAGEVAEILVNRFGYGAEAANAAAPLCGGSVGTALRNTGDSEETEEFAGLFRDLMTAAVSKDLLSTLETSEKISALSSREKQKAFCIFACECIRKIFLFRKGMETTAYAAESDIAFYSSMAGKCSDAFCVETEQALSTATMLLERNVNAKIVFCDLVDSMFLNV